jgi:integrase
MKVGREGMTTLDCDEEEIALDRTPSERSLFQSYRYAQKTCANIDRARTADSPLGNGNTVKDLAEVVQHAPVSVYTRVQTLHLAKVLALTALKRPLTREERTLVIVTLFNGIMLSAGLRIGEPGALRVGVHMPTDFDVGVRVILRHTDRKNRRRHPFTFRGEFLPSWFLVFYRTIVWPSLLNLGGHEAMPAPWLFLHPATGKPFVNSDEGTLGENRDEHVRRSRTKQLRRMWRKAIGKACSELKIQLPGTSYTVTPHCVRNVVANEIFQALGQADAAAFLGDREGTVLGVYGELNGMTVDSSKVVGKSRIDREKVASST